MTDEKGDNMESKFNLSGAWQFELDKEQVGTEQGFFKKELNDSILLPTTTSEAKKGLLNKKRETEHLTEVYAFEGDAWYSRAISFSPEVLAYLKENKIELFMERTRKTKVWVDEQYVGEQLSFSTAQVYDLTPFITKENHRLTVMVSNVDYPAIGGHMTSPDTQTNWNGILGEISLRIYDTVALEEVQVYPSVENKHVEAHLTINNFSAQDEIEVIYYATLKGAQVEETYLEKQVVTKKVKMSLQEGKNKIAVTYLMPEEIRLWDEYNPVLYDFHVLISKAGEVCATQKVSFGFRDFTTDGVNFLINGRKTLLRGKHEGMLFPLTGYAPMDKAGWLRVFKIAKEYGINHYRYHTCCPPKAAFEAADEIGMYLQPEIPFWGSMLAPEDEGYDAHMQSFLEAEGYRILKDFGNHPSFMMMSMGNELWGSKKTIAKMVMAYKKVDPRHLYTQGSNNFQFYPTKEKSDDFFSGVRFSKERLIRGSYAMCDAPLGHIQEVAPNTVHNYDAMIRPERKVVANENSGKKMIEIQYGTGVKLVEASDEGEMIPDIPVVSHEIGQYETFPNFQEIEKYTGVLKAKNLEIFKERLDDMEMLDQAEDFFHASGKLASECYKMELETAFRSKELAGFQLLDLQDFQGQGTALVGVLDAFMDNKGIISAEKWRDFCKDAVLLAELSSFVQEAGSTLQSKIKLSFYRPNPLNNPKLIVQMINDKGGIIDKQEEVLASITTQGLFTLKEIQITLPQVEKPEKLILTIHIEETDLCNTYELWLYPKNCRGQETEEVFITQDKKLALAALEEGKKVLFMPKTADQVHAIRGDYCTDFWCYTMFKSISESVNKEVPIGTMGLLIQNQHPALAAFPCETYTTPQWWEILQNAACTILDHLPIKPIVQMIDNFGRNHKLGIIYEAQVGKGKLLICTADIKDNKDMASQWLYYSLKQYIASSAFNPKATLSAHHIEKLFEKTK